MAKGRNAIPTFGARLLELRQRAGLSREALAAASGSSFSGVAMMERGERWPSLELAGRLARALGCLVDDLLQPPGAPVTAAREPLRPPTPPKPRGRPRKAAAEQQAGDSA
jgi:transcriptional regulator with XRE-family HTH domain